MYAIVDIETTGFGGSQNRITEISIFVHDGQKVIKEFTSLVNPETSISYRISGLTGITNQMVREAPKFYEIAKEVIEYTQDCVFVAHSVNFDYNVIKYELQELGASFKRKKLCTVRLSRKLIPGQRSYSLGNLCSNLGIKINGRHRARGDAEATVILFEKLMALDNNGTFDSFLNNKSRQATLPPLLPKDVIDELPNKTGVYYFRDTNDKIIYVGKAKDIKSRVLSHIYDKSSKELKLCRETADITYSLTGNELTALLLESDEIKKHFPKYNRSQKRNGHSYGINTYQDRRGVRHIVYDRSNNMTSPILKFYNLTQCRSFLEKFCEEHNLCPKYCGLQNISGACFHYHIKKCRGVCRNEEDVEEYNNRVNIALKSLLNSDSYMIKEEGTKQGEEVVVLVKNGVYKGFGFFSTNKRKKSFSDYEKVVEFRQDNSDIQRILRSYNNKREMQKLTKAQEKLVVNKGHMA